MHFAVALSLVCLGATAALAAESKPLQISMERSALGYHSSANLLFFSDHTDLVRNSNLGCAPSNIVEVGAFSKKEKTPVQRDFFEQIRVRVARRKQAPIATKVPERTYFKVAGFDLSDEAQYARAVELEFHRSCPGRVQWTPQKLAAKLEWRAEQIIITPATNKGTWDVAHSKKLSLKDARCFASGLANLLCNVPGWGQVLFSKK